MDMSHRLYSSTPSTSCTPLRAPFSGIVSERPVKQGDIVQSGAVLLTLVDPGSLKYEGTVPLESRAGLRSIGLPVTLLVRADGTVAHRVDGAVDSVAGLEALISEHLGVPAASGSPS